METVLASSDLGAQVLAVWEWAGSLDGNWAFLAGIGVALIVIRLMFKWGWMLFLAAVGLVSFGGTATLSKVVSTEQLAEVLNIDVQEYAEELFPDLKLLEEDDEPEDTRRSQRERPRKGK